MPLGPGPRSKSTIATSGSRDSKFSSAPAALSVAATTFIPPADKAAESVVRVNISSSTSKTLARPILQVSLKRELRVRAR